MAGRKKKFTHPRLMTVDPKFAPCSTQENDEIFTNGILKFNIYRMLADIEAGLLNAVPIQIDVKKWYMQYL